MARHARFPDCPRLALLLPVIAICAAGGARGDSTGSGFFVNRDWVVTNDHVVADCDRVEVAGHGAATALRRDAGPDLAALRVARPFDGDALALRTVPLLLADSVQALGYPLSGVLSPSIRVTSGSVSARDGFETDDGLVQISAPIQPGNSGGPVIGPDGHVGAVATGVLNGPGAQNVNFAISIELLRDFLNDNAIDHTRAGARASADTVADRVARAAAATVQVRCIGPAQTRPDAAPQRMIGGFAMAAARDIVGHDFRTLRDASLSACLIACRESGRCRAFTYNLRHDVCFLKDGARLLVAHADAISGHLPEMTRAITDTGFRLSANADSPSGDYRVVRDAPLQSCIAQCARDRQCRGFAHVTASGDCWLKDRLRAPQSQPGVTFGAG